MFKKFILLLYLCELRAPARNIFFILLLAVPLVCYAKVDWLSFTWDNDVFLGEDDGYTNGG